MGMWCIVECHLRIGGGECCAFVKVSSVVRYLHWTIAVQGLPLVALLWLWCLLPTRHSLRIRHIAVLVLPILALTSIPVGEEKQTFISFKCNAFKRRLFCYKVDNYALLHTLIALPNIRISLLHYGRSILKISQCLRAILHTVLSYNHNREICIALFQHPLLTALYRKFLKIDRSLV